MRNKKARDWYPSMRAKADQVEPTAVHARDLGAGGRHTNQRLVKPASVPADASGMPAGPDVPETRKRVGERPAQGSATATTPSDLRRKKNGAYNRTVRIGKGA